MLKSTLIHSNPQEYYDFYKHFKDNIGVKNACTIREFVNKIQRDSRPLIKKDYEKYKKYKGDMLEVFAELFFNQYSSDPAIGIKDYTPISITDDFGVDATGINVNGHKVAIQVKYRANMKNEIDYASIAKTYTSACCGNSINHNNDYIIYLFTTCLGANWQAKKVLGNKLVVINKQIIGNKVDNNYNFWENAYKEIYDTLN